MSKPPRSGYNRARVAGWSSLVARRAHNPEVAGSNPAPATGKPRKRGFPVAQAHPAPKSARLLVHAALAELALPALGAEGVPCANFVQFDAPVPECVLIRAWLAAALEATLRRIDVSEELLCRLKAQASPPAGKCPRIGRRCLGRD